MWKKEYKKRRFYWGLKPDVGLKEAVKYARRGIALDLGAGEGRNSVFLAKNGFEVEAIDKIKNGLEKCEKLSQRCNLTIKTENIDIRKFRFEKNRYSLILSIATLDFFKFSEIKKIVSKIQKSLKKDGVFYLVVFSEKDPLFNDCRGRKLKTIEKDTFYVPKLKTFQHFFRKEELSKLFKNFKIIKIKSKKIRESHGGKSHLHYIIINIVKKRG